MRYYTFEGYPYLNGQGMPFIPGTPGQGGKRVWPEAIESMRRICDMAVVDQTAENHPSPKAGCGWARVMSNADLSCFAGFVEVNAESADGEIIHKIYGEEHGQYSGGICHKVSRSQTSIDNAVKRKSDCETQIDKIDSDLLAIKGANLNLLFAETMLKNEKANFIKGRDTSADVIAIHQPKLDQLKIDMSELKAELETKRSG